MLDPLVRPWSGSAYRHLPRAAAYDVLDFRLAGRAPGNRWNSSGEPTLYLAGDVGVTLAEFARHYHSSHSRSLPYEVEHRQVYRLHLELDRVLDLREPDVVRALSIQDAPRCFLNRDLARATARFLRSISTIQGILVPSIAFLDDPERWVLVLFLERLPRDPRVFISDVQADAMIHLEQPELDTGS